MHDTTDRTDVFCEQVHARGAEFLATRSAVYVFPDDATAYRVPLDDLDAFDAADDLDPWRVAPTCAGCGSTFDYRRVDSRGHAFGDRPTPDYPFCVFCHYNGRAGDVRHADVLAACEARGLIATTWQTGGGCMNLAVYRDHGGAHAESYPDDDADPSLFVPYVCAVGAWLDGDTWRADDASLPDAGGPWCAFDVLDVATSYGEGDTWERPTLPLDADALAAHADAVLPPARSHVVRVAGVDVLAVTAADALDALAAATAANPGEAVTLAAR